MSFTIENSGQLVFTDANNSVNWAMSLNPDGTISFNHLVPPTEVITISSQGLTVMGPNGITFSDATNQTTAAVSPNLSAYALLASPALTGTPTVNGVPITPAVVPNQQFVSVHVGVVASATPSGLVTVTLPVPYADTNFLVQGSVLVAETPGVGAATEIVCIGMTQILTNQTFCFNVCNASSGVHDVTCCFTTFHS